jgi:hypothetical protein
VISSPLILYPKFDHKIVDPTNYEDWDQRIYEMVRHHKARGAGGLYWEVSNEREIGEDLSCPYLSAPENYPRYYQHTVACRSRCSRRTCPGPFRLTDFARAPCHAGGIGVRKMGWPV